MSQGDPLPFSGDSLRTTATIMDGEVRRYGGGYYEGYEPKPFIGKPHHKWSAQVNASRNGVSINGSFPVYKEREDIDRIIRALNNAWKDFERLQK